LSDFRTGSSIVSDFRTLCTLGRDGVRVFCKTHYQFNCNGQM
jgi:hypothetical protein